MRGFWSALQDKGISMHLFCIRMHVKSRTSGRFERLKTRQFDRSEVSIRGTCNFMIFLHLSRSDRV